jgi:hypothetical protein
MALNNQIVFVTVLSGIGHDWLFRFFIGLPEKCCHKGKDVI